MKRLDGKVALISETARGQGRAAALRFAAEGATVVGGDLLHEAALESQRLMAKAGDTALTPGPPDVIEKGSVRAWVEEAVAAFGGIHILHAHAVRFGTLGTQPYEDFTFTMRAELAPVWLAAHVVWAHLGRSRGCVLTAGSTAGLNNQRTAHSASKGAVIALTRQLAAEGARYGIRANCVSPGTIDTEGSRGDLLADDHPMRTIPRVRVPDEVVDAAVLLASDEASYITKANLVVDGGWSTVLPGAVH
ncbi:SDR family NAD(P)-dependent oxidoreductase [Streptomyces sp. SP18BB07]|uniref:SDR family NAD(P)-dependent oxidoreductase n=1 Tax=Streptomyces sp. SP18BB07 TaxID=3002522 RepID=UPI002E7A9528|nr:SDR family oxidoreductase [Streptomyces sp. SP18BB07]MEE1765147.1 SDR family oxidoreductase [Streptomyces sp. SP18BB07]